MAGCSLSRDGEFVVMRPAIEFQCAAQYPLNEDCESTPAVALGRLFVRTESICGHLGERRKRPRRDQAGTVQLLNRSEEVLTK